MSNSLESEGHTNSQEREEGQRVESSRRKLFDFRCFDERRRGSDSAGYPSGWCCSWCHRIIRTRATVRSIIVVIAALTTQR